MAKKHAFSGYFHERFLKREISTGHILTESERTELFDRLACAVQVLPEKTLYFVDEDGLQNETEAIARHVGVSPVPQLYAAEFDLADTMALHRDTPADLVFVHITDEACLNFALSLHGRGLPVFGLTTENEPDRDSFRFSRELFCQQLKLPHAPKYHEANLHEYVAFWEKVAQGLAFYKTTPQEIRFYTNQKPR